VAVPLHAIDPETNKGLWLGDVPEGSGDAGDGVVMIVLSAVVAGDSSQKCTRPGSCARVQAHRHRGYVDE